MGIYLRRCVSDFCGVYNLSKITAVSIVLGVVVVIMDYYNIPTQILSEVPTQILWLIFAAGIMLIFIWLSAWHCFDLIRIIAVNPLDIFVYGVVVSFIVYIPGRTLILGASSYISCASVLAFAMLVFLFWRCICRNKMRIESERKCSNLVDLKDLYDNKFTRIPEMPILIQENDVDYDLFERSEIINRLYRSIVHCQPDMSYVISLEGAWGCGKTTIINNVKRLIEINSQIQGDIIVIDDFDPWLFGSQESLLTAMYDSLIQHVGLGYSNSRNSLAVKSIVQVVSEKYTAGGILYNLLCRNHNCDEIVMLKRRISSYLLTSNKRVVFFIDNLDRANDENIVFLFKLISLVFDLPGVVYVLSFERERINAILKETREIDQRFTEKIIQQEIVVPTIGEEKSKEVYSMCVSNLLEAYGLGWKEFKVLEPVVDYIIAQTRNVRMFKRILNSVFSTVFCYETILNKKDLLAIEAIRFFDSELYVQIYQNSRFFISHEKTVHDAFKIGVNKSKFNSEGKEFFNRLFEQHSNSKEILRIIFPYVDRYLQESALEYDAYVSDSEASEISRQTRICSGKYFDLYFSYTSNAYIRIREVLNNFVRKVNDINSVLEGIQVIKEALQSLEFNEQREWVEQLQCNILNIPSEKSYYIAAAMYEILYELNDDKQFFALTPQARMEYIISEFLTLCTDDEFYCFQSNIQDDYKKLKVIKGIIYWMSNATNNRDVVKTRAELLRQQLEEMCERILRDKINIYSGEYYHAENAWTLYHYLKEQEKESRFSEYIMSSISDDTVYRILWDIVSVSIGDNYRYSINEENMRAYFGNSANLETLLNRTPPRTEDEKFVKKVCDYYIEGEKDTWGRASVFTSCSQKLQL